MVRKKKLAPSEFGCTSFGRDSWIKWPPITINMLLISLNWKQTAPGLSYWNGAFSQRQFWDFSKGVQLDLNLDPLLTTSALSGALYPTMDVFRSIFAVIVLLIQPWTVTQTQLSDIGPSIAPQSLHDTMYTVNVPIARVSKTTPKHIWTFTIFDSRYLVLFFVNRILFL